LIPVAGKEEAPDCAAFTVHQKHASIGYQTIHSVIRMPAIGNAWTQRAVKPSAHLIDPFQKQSKTSELVELTVESVARHSETKTRMDECDGVMAPIVFL
jgi:hypothetical protein